MKYDYLIIDMNNLYYRAVNVVDQKMVEYKSQKVNVNGVVQALKMILNLKSNFLTDTGTTYFLWDNPTSKDVQRKSILETYKGNREKMSKRFYREMDFLELILKHHSGNSFTCRAKHLEADDLVLPILERKIPKDKTVLLVSNDMDWMRPISDNIHSLYMGKIYDPTMFENQFGFAPSISNICFYKVFYGDDSDNIKPVLSQMPKVLFKRIIQECGNIYDLIIKGNNKELGLDLGWIKRVNQEKQLLIKTWEIVDFVEIGEDLFSYLHECTFKKEKLEILYTLYQLPISTFDKRFKKVEVDILAQMLGGEEVARK